jgi:hypothetical protein
MIYLLIDSLIAWQVYLFTSLTDGQHQKGRLLAALLS